MRYLFQKTHILFSIFCRVATGILFLLQASNADDDFRAAHGSFFHLLHAERQELAVSYLQETDRKAALGTNFDLTIYNAQLELPQPLGEDSYWRWGAEYNARQYEFGSNGGALTSLDKETFHRALLSGGIGTFLSENLLLTGIIKGGVLSNFGDSLVEDDFAVRGEGLLVYRLNPGAQLLLGGRYAKDFADNSLYPLLGIRLLSEDGRLHLALTAPVELRIGYNIVDYWQVFARGELQGDEYNLQEFVSAAGEAEDGTFRYQDRRLAAGMILWLFGHLSLQAEVGYTLGSTIEFELPQNRVAERDIEDDLYFRAQVGVAF